MTPPDTTSAEARVFAAPTGDTITPSLSEITSLATRAARGAGFDWGEAEDIGQAVAWLAARGLPGCELLLQRLEAGPMSRPMPEGGHWRCDDRQCPLQTGMALADRARLDDGPSGGPGGGPGGGALTLHAVGFPGLLLPFLAVAARLLGRALDLRAEGITLRVHPDGRTGPDRHCLLFCGMERADVRLDQAAVRMEENPAGSGTTQPAPVPLQVWKRLDHWALMTTVPTSETSTSGAGAGQDDND